LGLKRRRKGKKILIWKGIKRDFFGKIKPQKKKLTKQNK